jgi:hypothetical protein
MKGANERFIMLGTTDHLELEMIDGRLLIRDLNNPALDRIADDWETAAGLIEGMLFGTTTVREYYQEKEKRDKK